MGPEAVKVETSMTLNSSSVYQAKGSCEQPDVSSGTGGSRPGSSTPQHRSRVILMMAASLPEAAQSRRAERSQPDDDGESSPSVAVPSSADGHLPSRLTPL